MTAPAMRPWCRDYSTVAIRVNTPISLLSREPVDQLAIPAMTFLSALRCIVPYPFT